MPSDDSRTLKDIYSELVSTPFFPLLFIAEVFKVAAVTFTDVTPVVSYAVLAVIATIMWALSDTVEVDVGVTDNGFLK